MSFSMTKARNRTKENNFMIQLKTPQTKHSKSKTKYLQITIKSARNSRDSSQPNRLAE